MAQAALLSTKKAPKSLEASIMLIRHPQTGEHRKMLLVQGDNNGTHVFGRCGNERIDEANAVALMVLPAIETPFLGDFGAEWDHMKKRQELIKLSAFLSFPNTAIEFRNGQG